MSCGFRTLSNDLHESVTGGVLKLKMAMFSLIRKIEIQGSRRESLSERKSRKKKKKTNKHRVHRVASSTFHRVLIDYR